MIDFAEPLIIPRPRTRPLDKLLAWVDRATPYIIAGLIGGSLGVWQGYMQCDKSWTDKVVTRSTVDPSGIALPVYEDALGNVYYSHMERRNQ